MKTIRATSGMIVIFFIFLGFTAIQVNAETALRQQVLVDEARIVIDDFTHDPDMEQFRAYLKDARGILVVPDLYKGAWFLGGSGGRGLLLVRDEKSGDWFGPAFYTMGSISIGFQFGGQKSEVIILVMTQKGLESLKSTSIKIGGDVSVAVGPVGAGAQGASAPSLHVDYIAFSRAKGAFLGFSLDGAIIKENYDWNKAYYGKPVRPRDIITDHNAINPNALKLRSSVVNASRMTP